jgi:hypothetical protein
MNNYNEKSGSGIRNVNDENEIYPEGAKTVHNTKEDIKPLPPEAKPDQTKKSDLHYVGESSKGVKKTNMANKGDEEGNGDDPKENRDEPLIEETTWDAPQPEKDKDNPL